MFDVMWLTSGKGQLFWWYFDLSWEVVIMDGGISYKKQKFRAYTLIWLHLTSIKKKVGPRKVTWPELRFEARKRVKNREGAV